MKIILNLLFLFFSFCVLCLKSAKIKSGNKSRSKNKNEIANDNNGNEIANDNNQLIGGRQNLPFGANLSPNNKVGFHQPQPQHLQIPFGANLGLNNNKGDFPQPQQNLNYMANSNLGNSVEGLRTPLYTQSVGPLGPTQDQGGQISNINMRQGIMEQNFQPFNNQGIPSIPGIPGMPLNFNNPKSMPTPTPTPIRQQDPFNFPDNINMNFNIPDPNFSNLVNRGSEYFRLGEYNKGLDYYSQALDRFENLNNFDSIDFSSLNNPNFLINKIENDLQINAGGFDNSKNNNIIIIGEGIVNDNKAITNSANGNTNSIANDNKSITSTPSNTPNDSEIDKEESDIEKRLNEIEADKIKKQNFMKKFKNVLRKLKKYRKETKSLKIDLETANNRKDENIVNRNNNIVGNKINLSSDGNKSFQIEIKEKDTHTNTQSNAHSNSNANLNNNHNNKSNTHSNSNKNLNNNNHYNNNHNLRDRVLKRESINKSNNKINIENNTNKKRTITNTNFNNNPNKQSNFIEWIKSTTFDKQVSMKYIEIKRKENNPHNNLSCNSKNEEVKLLTNSEVKKYENLIKIEKKLILSKKSQIAEKICTKLQTIPEFKNNYDKICLSVVLLTINNSNTNNELKSSHNNFITAYFNYNYINNLSYENFPIFYKDKELKLIKGTYFNSFLKTRRNLFEKEYEILNKNKIIKKIEIELKEYIKARTFVISKNIKINSSDLEERNFNIAGLSILIPILDKIKINHSNDFNCDFNYINSVLYLNSTRKIAKGEEITMKAGNMSNDNLLIYYGYTINNNKIKSEIFLDVKINSVSANNTESVLLTADYDLNKVLELFRKIITNAEVSLNKTLEIESQAINILKRSLKAQLDKYVNNYQSDIIVFKTKFANLTQNEISIYRVIIEEKRRVNAYYNLASFFNKIFYLVINNKNVSDNLLRKISVIKAYQKYYRSIKEIFKNRKIELKEEEDFEKELLQADRDRDEYMDNSSKLNGNKNIPNLIGSQKDQINKLENKVYDINIEDEFELDDEDYEEGYEEDDDY